MRRGEMGSTVERSEGMMAGLPVRPGTHGGIAGEDDGAH